MHPDHKNIDLVIQFALLTAGDQDDSYDQNLGPIHLIKYAYLADLAYAKSNSGQSFTGIDWQFYKFGPWSSVVHNRIEPALRQINANKNVFNSSSEDKSDCIRWSIKNESLFNSIQGKLPYTVTNRIRIEVRKFSNNTSFLLDHVYRTEPMLNAGPMEILDLSTKSSASKDVDDQPLKFESLSNKKKKQFAQGIKQLREKAALRPKPKLLVPVPKYPDEVFHEGLRWLDEIAGPKLPETATTVTVKFSEAVWKSETRRADEVP